MVPGTESLRPFSLCPQPSQPHLQTLLSTFPVAATLQMSTPALSVPWASGSLDNIFCPCPPRSSPVLSLQILISPTVLHRGWTCALPRHTDFYHPLPWLCIVIQPCAYSPWAGTWSVFHSILFLPLSQALNTCSWKQWLNSIILQ